MNRRAGLPVTGAVHVLRHTFCSHLAMNGAPVRVIQELAGHRDLSTTLRYMHLAKGAKHNAIELLDKARESGPSHRASLAKIINGVSGTSESG